MHGHVSLDAQQSQRSPSIRCQEGHARCTYRQAAISACMYYFIKGISTALTRCRITLIIQITFKSQPGSQGSQSSGLYVWVGLGRTGQFGESDISAPDKLCNRTGMHACAQRNRT
jgi:hypothetical protein